MQESIKAQDITWVNVEAPNNDELAAIVREVNLIPVDAEFVVRDHQRAEIALRGDYVLVLIHVPVFDRQVRVTSGAALYFLITPTLVRTIQYEPIVSLKKIFEEFSHSPERQEEYFGDSSLSLALHVISQINLSSFSKIAHLAKNLEIAEDAVFQGNERKMVEEVAILSRDVLDFCRIIRPQANLFAKAPDASFSREVAVQWQRLSSQLQQMWEILESLNESAKELRSTNDSLLQHKENELLRMLSFFSIIIIPALLLGGSYNSASATYEKMFWIVLVAVMLLLGLTFWRAKRRNIL